MVDRRLVGTLSLVVFAWLISARSMYGQVSPSIRDCSAYPYAPPYPAAPASYVPRHHGVAQTFLDMEKGTGPVTPSEYAILDALQDEAKKRLKPIPAGLPTNEYDAFAVNSLKTMDCILVRHGFVYPGKGWVQLLSDGLDTTTFTGDYLQALKNKDHNIGRGPFIEKRGWGPFYVVDCDIASFLYLAMGEVLGYPLAMVDMQGHNFIRWKRPDGTYIDFETMDGIQTDDRHYISGWGIPPAFVQTAGALTTMNRSQLIAYEYYGLGLSRSWLHDYPGTIANYVKSISVDATLYDSANNLSWLYVVIPDTSLRNAQKAISYGLQATAIFPNGDSLDTLACAYAFSGDFATAIQTEEKAIQAGWAPLGSHPVADENLFKAQKLCDDPHFGQDPRPFRQPVTAPPLSAQTNAGSETRLK